MPLNVCYPTVSHDGAYVKSIKNQIFFQTLFFRNRAKNNSTLFQKSAGKKFFRTFSEKGLEIYTSIQNILSVTYALSYYGKAKYTKLLTFFRFVLMGLVLSFALFDLLPATLNRDWSFLELFWLFDFPIVLPCYSKIGYISCNKTTFSCYYLCRLDICRRQVRWETDLPVTRG